MAASFYRSATFSNRSIAFEKRGEIATHLKAVFASDPDADKKLAECITSYIDEEVTYCGDKTLEQAKKMFRNMRTPPTHGEVMKHVDGRFQIYMARITNCVEELVTDCMTEKIEIVKQELIADLVTPLRIEVASLKKELAEIKTSASKSTIWDPNTMLADMQAQLNRLEKEYHAFYADFVQNFAPTVTAEIEEITKICNSLNTSSAC